MTNPTTVLVVDDNEDCLLLVHRMLDVPGFRVLSANSGGDAIEILQEESPDIMLLDVMMPGMTGFEVLTALRESARHYALPVIMVTASTNDNDVMTAYKSGSDYFINKPFTADQLRYGIDLVLGGKPAAAAGAA